MAKIKHPHQARAAREARQPPGICLYVDNSNMFHEGQRYAEKFARESRGGFRLHFANFIQLVSQDRPMREVVWGGSTPPETDTVWGYLTERSIKPELLERGPSGENETVDHAIQVRMYRHARKYRDQTGTMVLCTGDGKGYHKEEGFLYDIEGFVEDGWDLELYCWTHCCHTKLREFAEKHGKFIPLEKFYGSISYIEAGRRVMSVDLNDLWR